MSYKSWPAKWRENREWPRVFLQFAKCKFKKPHSHDVWKLNGEPTSWWIMTSQRLKLFFSDTFSISLNASFINTGVRIELDCAAEKASNRTCCPSVRGRTSGGTCRSRRRSGSRKRGASELRTWQKINPFCRMQAHWVSLPAASEIVIVVPRKKSLWKKA